MGGKVEKRANPRFKAKWLLVIQGNRSGADHRQRSW
jgi:hypothetical protein